MKKYIVIIIALFLVIVWLGQKEQSQQMKDLNDLNNRIIGLNKNQAVLDDKFNELHTEIIYTMTAEAANIGEASYYDYTLPGGWSSLKHRVCASRNYAKGTMLEVTNTQTQAKVDCLVTDYGPDNSVFPERIIDLSSFSFSQIADLSEGVINVSIKEVK